MRWVLVLLLAGCDCGSDVPEPGSVCPEAVDMDDCFEDCDEGSCPAGLYCSDDGRCVADCDPSAGLQCAEGQLCGLNGRCTPDPTQQDGGNGICADVEVSARRVTPNVVVVVDQSGSMTDDFDNGTRWEVLKSSLLDEPDGLIFSLQSTVRFGLALFSARAEENTSGPPIGMCPLVETVDPAIDNFDAINAVYGPAEPIDETPTGDSLQFLLDRLNSTPDPSEDPTIFILATDGEPDRCEELNPQNGQQESIDAIEAAYNMGIRTFVISVGEGVVSDEHLQAAANAGVGVRGGDPDAPFWEAGDDRGLRSALEEIVGGALSCVVTLEGSINPEEACTGTVTLNGMELPCDDPDGWEAVDTTHIELRGEACDMFQDNPGVTLRASFPCNVVLI